MAIGDKKPVVMESDRGIPNGVATLGTDGKLADAQIPELDKLGAAPSGFGLGGAGKPLTASYDLNSVWECGFYYWTDAPTNAPFAYGVMVVSSRNDRVYTQEITKAGGDWQNCKVRRSRYTDTINEWEWENPPMTVGVEYRTTERYNGKPVYRKLVDCGTFTDGKTVELVSDAYRIISGTARAGTQPLPYWDDGKIGDTSKAWNAYYVLGPAQIYLYGGASASSFGTVYADIKFFTA